ncbi:hypothetical protein SO802_023599 [Lithocarpus litseifolius]|uniref:Hexosyltransferase n=1 Tax=Lithocarpus litseifolius TaxID=425828 RepID=A0AAW2C7Z6_9ROSI
MPLLSHCQRHIRWRPPSLDNLSMIHIMMTLDETYLRGSIARVFSVLQHASCPENIIFHFIASRLYSHNNNLIHVIISMFSYLSFHLYLFNSNLVKGKISYSIRCALNQPLNYVGIYLADLVPSVVHQIIYFNSDLIVADDVAKLWNINLGAQSLARRMESRKNNVVSVAKFVV